MELHNQLQMYVGLEEGGCQDVATIKLDGFTLVSTKALELLLSERDALAAHNSELVSACKLAIDMFVANECNVPNTIETLQDAIDGNPQQCLAEIKAEAGRAGYHEALQEHSGATTSAEDYQLADQYAARVRQDEQSGTWLKDSNVNGGKRQGGE